MTVHDRRSLRGWGFIVRDWTPALAAGSWRLEPGHDLIRCPTREQHWSYPVRQPMKAGGLLRLLDHARGHEES